MLSFYTDVLDIATQNDGKVFGGFVRDVIVPYLNNKETSKPKDMDLWFTCEECLIKFGSLMKLKYPSSKNYDYFYVKNCVSYGVNIKRYHLRIEFEEQFMHLDLVLSDEIPVNDFKFNTLCYSYQDGVFVPFNYSEKKIQQILNKEAHMLPNYIPIIKSKIDNLGMRTIKRIQERYVNIGYKVFLPNKEEIPRFPKDDYRYKIRRVVKNYMKKDV